MEGSTGTGVADVEVLARSDDDDPGAHEDGPIIPAAVAAAQDGKVTERGEEELDATSWLLDSDVPTADEVEPTTIRLNVGSPAKPKLIEWKVVPLPDGEFRKFRKLVTGGRRQRRAIAQGDVMEVDDWQFHLLVVAAATVYPDLKATASAKGVADVTQILRHRFAAKPGLINQISGIVSDLSGMDEADAEVVAGNS